MDAYQQAVEYLTANPGEISSAWLSPAFGRGGCLFRFANESGVADGRCGCLTMIRRESFLGGEAATPQLTAAIFCDKRIPLNSRTLTPDHLPIFAGWQRRIDQILGRTPPAMDPRIPLPTGDIEIPEVTPALLEQSK